MGLRHPPRPPEHQVPLRLGPESSQLTHHLLRGQTNRCLLPQTQRPAVLPLTQTTRISHRDLLPQKPSRLRRSRIVPRNTRLGPADQTSSPQIQKNAQRYSDPHQIHQKRSTPGQCQPECLPRRQRFHPHHHHSPRNTGNHHEHIPPVRNPRTHHPRIVLRQTHRTASRGKGRNRCLLSGKRNIRHQIRTHQKPILSSLLCSAPKGTTDLPRPS